MSQENVDNFRRGLEAYNRGDLDALMEELDPDVEWRPALAVLLGGEQAVFFAGTRECGSSIQEEHEALAMYQAEISEIRDLGDSVLAIGRFRVRGKESGVRSSRPSVSWSTTGTARQIRLRTYLDLDEALEAAGLAE